MVQELDDPVQQVTDPEALTVFLRRWNPAQMTLGPFVELTINSKLNRLSSGLDQINHLFRFLQQMTK